MTQQKFFNFVNQKNWWSESVNFWTGCRKVSAGCKFCYMFREQEMHKNDPTLIKRTKEGNWKKVAKYKGKKVIFVNSWSDFFVDVMEPDPNNTDQMIDIADGWRKDAWEVIKAHPEHIFIIPTKRIDRVKQSLPDDWGDGYPNVWLGTSVENQVTADTRIPILASIPAAVRFLSMEPLLEFVTLSGLPVEQIHWFITGGESGNDTGKWGYRPSQIEAFKNVVEQVHAIKKPVFVKQLGTHLAKELQLKDRTGSNMTEMHFPSALRFREFPIPMTEYLQSEIVPVAEKV